MNNKMAINTYLSTIDSKNKISRTETDTQIQRTFCQLPDGVWGLGEKYDGIKKYKLVVLE